MSVISDWVLTYRVFIMFSEIDPTNPFELVRTLAFIFLFASSQTAQLAVAHEIFHKPGLFHRGLAIIHLMKNLYIHFIYEHLYGHHRRVGTPEDPASAEKGVNVYRFFVRSVIGSWKSVYKMEEE